MALLTFISNRSKGVNAYVAPINEKTWKTNHAHNRYPEPTSDAQQQLAHQDKAHDCSLDTETLADGCYVSKGAVAKQGTRCHYNYFVVQSGKMTDRFDSLDELIGHKTMLRHGELPELTGSEKQVAWATKIRGAYLAKRDCPISPLPLLAKWWIENREDLSGAIDDVLQALNDDVEADNRQDEDDFSDTENDNASETDNGDKPTKRGLTRSPLVK